MERYAIRYVSRCLYESSSGMNMVMRMSQKTCDVVIGEDARCGRDAHLGYNCVISTKDGDKTRTIHVCPRHQHVFEDFIQEQTEPF